MRTTTVGLLSACFLVACSGERRPADSPEHADAEQTYTNTDRIDEIESSSVVPVSGDNWETASQSGSDPARTPNTSAGFTDDDDRSPSSSAAGQRRDNESGTHSSGGAVAQDDSDEGLTPPDQLENKSDLEITQQIRQSVMDDDSLSFTAKNAKIITRDGRVTLKGTVESEQERTAIVEAARKVAGANNVDNQLQVSK